MAYLCDTAIVMLDHKNSMIAIVLYFFTNNFYILTYRFVLFVDLLTSLLSLILFFSFDLIRFSISSSNRFLSMARPAISIFIY